MITIKQKYIDEMIDHSRRENPNECCGILVGRDDVISQIFRVKNSAPSPYRYVMDPGEMMEVMRETDRQGIDLIAFYHSHTHSPAYPSETDTRMALESGWVDFCYVLVSLEDKVKPDVRFFVIDAEGNVSDQKVRVLP